MKTIFVSFFIMIIGVLILNGDSGPVKELLIQRIVDGKLHQKIGDLDDINDVLAPSYGYSDPVIPDVLYRVVLRLEFASDSSESDLIKNLKNFFLREYFSSKDITIISCESHFPGSRVSILYAEGNCLGEITLFLMKKKDGYQLLINLHTQMHSKLPNMERNGVKVEDLLKSK